MTTVLETILARKRVEVAKAKAATPPDVLRERVESIGRPRNFFKAVVNEHDRARTRVIAEVKRMSPSAGMIRDDFDPVGIARSYEQGGAAAISCLTDEQHFGGHLGYVQMIREAVELPVLRKDFIVDEYQVWESRAAHADAILLIADVLAEGELLDMMILAQKLGMTTLVETHDVDALLKVRPHIGFPHAGYSLLGINNRDLRTMKTDAGHIFRLLDMIENRSVVVCESGIGAAEDLVKLRRHAVNIVLVGEHLMRQPDPGRALRELLGGA
ncbi:MAG: indole-3-glycerol phosphate synthase TrpC [Planctomycetota bacterium]|jgi:indole-3-glycerol phosphate synthase